MRESLIQARKENDMAQPWYTLNLGDALLATQALERIRQMFQAESEQRSATRDMALFMRHESEGRLHCEVILYFPPNIAALAHKLGASTCAAPAPRDLGLLAGNDSAWRIWFPDHPGSLARDGKT